ncbi:MAG: hypothetical protein E6G96_20555, partial [Alphaproteobacteria bacterium]
MLPRARALESGKAAWDRPGRLIRGGWRSQSGSRNPAAGAVLAGDICLLTLNSMSCKAAMCAVTTVLWCFFGPGASADPLKFADTALEPVKWGDLAGWTADDHLAAFGAYQTSCQVLRKSRQPRDAGPIYSGLWDVCRSARDVRPQNAHAARAFFEQNFVPVRIARLGDLEGFLTGYYEPIVQGSRFPNPEFHVPLYRRPPDLVAAGHKPAAGPFPNKGALIGKRDEKNEIVPYH